MEEKTNIKIVTLYDLWGIFVHRLWIILIAAILFVSVYFAINTLTYVPRYESVATLYILQQNNLENDKNYEDFNLALKVVNDCTHLLKSHSVLDQVITDLDLDRSYNSLYNDVTVTNPTETRILQIKVESYSPYEAKTIVDKICTVGTEKITEAMGFEQVNFYEHGVLDLNPYNRTSTIEYIVLGLAVAVFTYLIFLVAYLLDDKIRTDEDIEHHLKASILGDIPNFEENSKKKYGGKYYRSKYYRRHRYYQYKSYGKENNK